MIAYTPMIQQYLTVKAQVPDAFLFFRLGDFYEMFFDDAILASRELELTLTGREGGVEERIPMCGIPYHAADTYIARLIEKGYKVAICDQVEDPAVAKGIVRREIVRMITPGTVMDSKVLGESSNNYIVSIVQDQGEFGFAACDVSTGECDSTSLIGSWELVIDELHVYQPSEIIASPSILKQLQEEQKFWSKKPTFTPWELADDHMIANYFPDHHTQSTWLTSSRQSVAQLLTYLQETQKKSLSHIRKLRLYASDQYMMMDPFTRRNLELVETVRERSKKGSLLWLLDRTVTAMGARMLRRWIEKPLLNESRIAERLEAVQHLTESFILQKDLEQLLKEIYDLQRLVARISYGSANARDLKALQYSLEQVPSIMELCRQSESNTLRQVVSQVDDCQDIKLWIAQAIVDEPPISVRDGGMIREGYHAELDTWLQASQHGVQWMADLEKREREATGIKSLKVGYNKIFGYYIEITKANIPLIPEGRYERKQTLANAERYVTPELKEQEALILNAQDSMISLEYSLISELRERVSGQVIRLQQIAEAIATLDTYQSLAKVSAQYHYTRPQIASSYDLTIEHGKHPVVEAVLDQGKFIANATSMLHEQSHILLITGPNMAGKSTYMRQVAMICIMAQIGCYVPARHAQIPIVDRIFTRIGAADDLIGGQSTFMIEMLDIHTMTQKATANSLVIIDELGRGTSTSEGMAIAQAVIEYLHEEVGCKTLVSTHFHELAHLEHSLAYLQNYSMAVKESGQQVTFLRKLIRGAASTSYGIYCAEIAGLPQSIIQRAYSLLQQGNSPHRVEQISFFNSIDQQQATSLHHIANQEQLLDEQQLLVLDQLRSLELGQMTPLQALNFLYQLQEQLDRE